ncbi:MAG TPA: hypothetical protein VHL11_04550 [Phototrophicaceae bacterium]|jgi:hypothetical protein|nr:hypothetical protein [Phototrophicaceae bacterium]
MSYQEKRSIVNLMSTILILALYANYMFQRYPEGNAYSGDLFRFWGSFFLILAPVMIGSKIIIYILFHVVNAITTNGEEPEITDERDKLIELKASRNSLYVYTVGFLLAMGSLALDMSPSVMFMVFIFTGIVSEVAGDVLQFYFYRRGI